MLDRGRIKLGIAPIGWTNDDMPDLGKENTFQQCISEMALAGYTGCEVGSQFPRDQKILKEALDVRGLEICNQWFSSFLITKPYEEVEKAFIEHIDFLKSMGARVVGISEQSHSVQGQLETPIFGHKYVMNDGEWKVFLEGLNKLGRTAKAHGIILTFHHHMGTVVQTAQEIDRMMEGTDPELLYLLFDSGHLFYCGEDPAAVLKKYMGRVAHIHLKDVRLKIVDEVKAGNRSFLAGVRAGTFTIPGDGDIDFDPIFDIIGHSDYEGYMVVEAEQDPAIANPFVYAKKARRFIAEKTGL